MIQEQFINRLLESKNSALITLNDLDVEFFSDYPKEFNYIKEHLKQYDAVPDKETFLNVFSDFPLIDVQEPDDYLLDELLKERTRNLIVSAVNNIRSAALNGKENDAIIALFEKTVQEAGSFVTLPAVDLIHNKDRYATYEDKCQNPNKYFITTGFAELDALIGGWDVNEDLVTIVARNGKGKSWVLFKCAAEAAKQGKRVGIYSGEMSEDAVGYRVDSILGHISNGALVHGGGSIRNAYKNYLDNLGEQISGNLFVLTPKVLHGFATPSKLKSFVEKNKLDILFVDQYSLMLDDEKSDVERIRLANISTGLKLLQSTKHIPIITVAQQNREKLDGSEAFDTTQIMGCDMIGQNSSNVIFIDRKDDLMRLYLGKLRQSGAVGKFLNYKIDLNVGVWDFVFDDSIPELSEMPHEDSQGNAYSDGDIF